MRNDANGAQHATSVRRSSLAIGERGESEIKVAEMAQLITFARVFVKERRERPEMIACQQQSVPLQQQSLVTIYFSYAIQLNTLPP